jgi:hypothetical protein
MMLAEVVGHGASPLCPRCFQAFLPRRKDQKYCAKTYAKAATRNAMQGPRTVASSWDIKRTVEARKGRVRGLFHAFYETMPCYRAAFLQRLIVEGRWCSAELRRLVTTRAVLQSWNRDQGTGRLHIAHVLDHYCQEVYGLRSYEVLNPTTVLPRTDDLAFPSEYYGPDQPPIYEDGTLTERPCSWLSSKVPTTL